MIDQDQARKFWASWVRREIGGSDVVQEAAAIAAVNEVLQGRDNRAAADAARRTAQSLGVGAPPTNASPPTIVPAPKPTRDAPFPGPGGEMPTMENRVPAPAFSPGKLLRQPWPYVAAVAAVALTAIVVIFAGRSVNTIGCLISQTTLADRTTTLHNAFVDVYNRDMNAIDACQAVDCEKAPKLEIVAALKTYNDALGKICWPNKDRADANALMSANTAMADAYTSWAMATTAAQDQTLQSTAGEQDTRESAADDTLARDLGVPSATAAPS